MELRCKIRAVLWSGLAVTVASLLWLGVVPGGTIAYGYDFTKPDYFIRKLTPEERVRPPADGEQAMVGDPVYFAVRTPRAFARAKLTVVYKNDGDIPVVEAGVLADKRVWRYQTKPLENRHLDALARDWPAIRQGETLLLQKQKRFDSVGDFLQNLPPQATVAVYNYALAPPYRLPGYEPDKTPKLFAYPVRGAYQFYTYIKDEPLDFRLYLTDLNQNKDADPVELKLWQGSELLRTVALDDDGEKGDTGRAAKEREIKLEAGRLAEGAYRLELVANDDVVTERIVSPQAKLAFIGKLWLADGAQAPLVLETDSQAVNFQTYNPAKLSAVMVGSNKLALDETYRQYSAVTEDAVSRLVLPASDIVVSGDGVFAASRASFINPSLAKVGPDFEPARRGIEYVIADYQPPASAQAGWQTAEAEFELGQAAYREFYKYSFMISAPGLKAEESPQRKLILKEIRVEFSGSSLWEKIKNKLHGK